MGVGGRIGMGKEDSACSLADCCFPAMDPLLDEETVGVILVMGDPPSPLVLPALPCICGLAALSAANRSMARLGSSSVAGAFFCPPNEPPNCRAASERSAGVPGNKMRLPLVVDEADEADEADETDETDETDDDDDDESSVAKDMASSLRLDAVL